MSLLATNPAQVTDQAERTDLPGSDPTPAPLASPAEAVFALFPSDSGTIEYLFGGGIADAVATPLDSPHEPTPDVGADAMKAVGSEGVSAHASAMPDIPQPFAGGTTDVPLSEPAAAAPAQPSLLRSTLAAEGGRLKALIARLGGPVASG
jgi:hypothetical protein